MLSKVWIARVRELALKYEWQSKNPDEMKIESAQKESELYFRHGFYHKSKIKEHEAELLKAIKSEQEDISKALYEYAGVIERLAECRAHMVPHKHDTEIIDYIVTGARYDETTK